METVTRRYRMIGLLVLAVLLAGGVLYAWHSWPPLLKYREKRLNAAYDDEIRRYLNGSDSLDVAAHRLAQVIVKLGFLLDRQQSVARADQSGSFVAITTIDHAPDIPREDPRVEELVLNAFKFANPPGVSEAFKGHSTQMWDSIIHTKGYRRVP